MQSYARIVGPSNTRVNVYKPAPLATTAEDYGATFVCNVGSKLVRYWPGFSIFVHDPEKDIISGAVAANGNWEIQNEHQLLGLHQRLEGHHNLSFLDIGANIGTLALFFAHNGYNTVAVEPLLYNAELQLASASLSKFDHLYTLVHGAVSDKPADDVCMYSAEDEWQLRNAGNGQLHMNVSDCSDIPGGLPKERVPIVTLDSVLSRSDRTSTQCFGTVKCDVEGFELAALRGAYNTLFDNPSCDRPCNILFEFTREFSHISNVADKDLFEFLQQLGYEFFSSKMLKVSLEDASSNTGDYFAILTNDRRCKL